MYVERCGSYNAALCSTSFKLRCFDVLFLNVVYALRPLMPFVMNFRMGCGMFVWCRLCVGVCMLTVSNNLLISSVTVIVCSTGLFWLNLFAMVLFIVCRAVLVDWLILKPCCVEICETLFVMYVFSSERSEMSMYHVSMFMSLFVLELV